MQAKCQSKTAKQYMEMKNIHSRQYLPLDREKGMCLERIPQSKTLIILYISCIHIYCYV